MAGSPRGAVVVPAALALMLACGGGEQMTVPADRGSLPGGPGPISPPDVSSTDPALQERVRASYASLVALRDSPGVPPATRAAAYGAVGKLLVAAELLEQAEPFLLHARAHAPGEMAWAYYLAHAYRQRNRYDEAIAMFEEVLRLEPTHVPTLVWLGAIHMDRGDVPAAEPFFRRAISQDPGSAAARFGLGRAALASGDHAAARDQLEAALRADPRAARIHYTLSSAYRALGDTARADAHLRQWELAFSPAESLEHVQIHPADPLMEDVGAALRTAVAYETRGVRALDAGRWHEAIAEFRGGLAVAPADPALHQNLGTALYLTGDAAGAAAEFETALRLSPGFARAHFSLGLLAESRGRDDEALERYAAAIRHDPTFADARFRLAEGLRRSGRVEASVAQYDDILRADPRASQARFSRAMALVRLSRYREARAALEEATSVHPDQPGLPHALARLLAAAPDGSVRDGPRALALVEELRRVYGATPPLLETFAMALAEVGRFGEAAARQREAIAGTRAQGRSEVAEAMTATLRGYESGLPCRTPWRDDDPVHAPARASGLRF